MEQFEISATCCLSLNLYIRALSNGTLKGFFVNLVIVASQILYLILNPIENHRGHIGVLRWAAVALTGAV